MGRDEKRLGDGTSNPTMWSLSCMNQRGEAVNQADQTLCRLKTKALIINTLQTCSDGHTTHQHRHHWTSLCLRRTTITAPFCRRHYTFSLRFLQIGFMSSWVENRWKGVVTTKPCMHCLTQREQDLIAQHTQLISVRHENQTHNNTL